MRKLLMLLLTTLMIFVTTVSGIACDVFDGNVSGTTDTAAPVILGITSTGITKTTATISWATNESATSNIAYGPTTSYGSSYPSPPDTIADKTNHSLTIGDLSYNTTYHFQVRSTDSSGNEAISGDNTFTTASLPEDNAPANTDNVNNVNPNPTSVSINMFYYGKHSAAIDKAIINANPEYLISTSQAGPMKGNADIKKFTTAGIKYFEYITGGYEEKYPKTLPVDLQSNFNFIDAVAAAGGYGIFFDEVSDGIWTIPDYSYLQQISSKAHSLGLKVVFNTGVNDWVDPLMDYCDYIGSTEQWANAPLTASQQKWANRTWLLRREGINDAVTAANLTTGAWGKGVIVAYATSNLAALPSWLPEYISLISPYSP